MIIDFHTHIFPDKIADKTIKSLGTLAGVKAATDGTLNGLLNSMEKSKVDLSVIMPVCTRPEQFESINTFAKKINDTYHGKLLSFGGIHPDCDNYKEKLDYIKALGLPGIKIHPDYQKVMIDDIRFMRIIEYASELGLVILTHAGIDIGLPEPVHCPPKKMRKVLDAVGPEKLVLAHLGGWKQWEEVYEYLAGENVYLDTAFLFGVCRNNVEIEIISQNTNTAANVPAYGQKRMEDSSLDYLNYIEQEMFCKILKKHDTNKILFATDSPWSDAVAGIEYIRSLFVSDEVKAQILGENALEMLKR